MLSAPRHKSPPLFRRLTKFAGLDLTIPVTRGPVTLVAYNGNGRWLATVTPDHVIRLWDARPGEQGTGELVRELKGHTAPIRDIVPGPAPNTLISVDEGETARLWDDTTGALIKSGPGTLIASNVIRAVSPDKTLEATLATNNTILVRDIATGALLTTLSGHTGEVLSLAFSSNGQKMASGSADGTARTWTVPLPPIPATALEKITAAMPAKASAAAQRPRRILVVWRADAILHKAGVPAVNHALALMSKKTGAFEADFTRDADAFDAAVLAKYDAIVMNSTAHLILNGAQRKAYLDYVRGGGGVVAIHAAIDMFLTWPEGAEVIGATFGDHPWGPNGTWAVTLEEPAHPLLRAFGGKNFKIRDEFYVMGEPYSRKDRRVLMSVDLSDPTSGAVNLVANPARAKDNDFALAWIKHYGKGRVFYADFGHIAEPFERAEILQFYLDGIQWVLGDLMAPQ